MFLLSSGENDQYFVSVQVVTVTTFLSGTCVDNTCNAIVCLPLLNSWIRSIYRLSENQYIIEQAMKAKP